MSSRETISNPSVLHIISEASKRSAADRIPYDRLGVTHEWFDWGEATDIIAAAADAVERKSYVETVTRQWGLAYTVDDTVREGTSVSRQEYGAGNFFNNPVIAQARFVEHKFDRRFLLEVVLQTKDKEVDIGFRDAAAVLFNLAPRQRKRQRLVARERGAWIRPDTTIGERHYPVDYIMMLGALARR